MKLKKHFLRLALFSALAVGVVLSSCSQNGDGKGAGTKGDAVTGTVKSESPTKLTCTDADGGVYTFTETTAPTVNANIRAGEEQKGGTFTYTINKVVKFSGIYTGDINQKTVTLTLKITKSVDSANVLIEIEEPKTTTFKITTTSFTTTIPELPVVERREVFGFYGPEWLINYVMAGNSLRSAVDVPADASREADSSSGQVTINVMSFTNEVSGLIKEYVKTHPNENIKLEITEVATTNGAYQPALDKALEKNAVDIYAAEAAFVKKYASGSISVREKDKNGNYIKDEDGYDVWKEIATAAPYKDFIEDFDAKLEAAQIAPYVVQIGSNTNDGLVALGYQSTGCCFIYRRDLAETIFGTDDPATIEEKIGAGTGDFEKFFKAAEECKKHDVSILSSLGDLYRMVEAAAKDPWINDDYDIQLDSTRKVYLDYAKKCIDNGWVNNLEDWTDGWYADMKGKEGTYGDWAVCEAPVAGFWGGTWIFASKHLLEEGNEAKLAAVAKIIEYMTLDTSNNGILYNWASGKLGYATDSVQSAVVMNAVDGTNSFCGDQDIHKVFVKADQKARGDLYTTFDEEINACWKAQARAYATGTKSKDEAIQAFKHDMDYKMGFGCVE